MKKPILVLVGTTLAFLLVLTGIFIGRNANRGIIPAEAVTNRDHSSTTQLESSQEEQYSNSSNTTGVININEASAEQLQLLPGIGETLSDRIVSYREENGSFQSIEQIMDVSGIGESKFSQIKDYITIGG